MKYLTTIYIYIYLTTIYNMLRYIIYNHGSKNQEKQSNREFAVLLSGSWRNQQQEASHLHPSGICPGKAELW